MDDAPSTGTDDDPDNDPEYVRYLAEAWVGEVGKYDRLVVLLSGGALALSVTLIGSRPVVEAPLKLILAAAWVLFLTSLGRILYSYVISKRAIEARWRHDHETGRNLSDKAWQVSLDAGWLALSGLTMLALFAVLTL